MYKLTVIALGLFLLGQQNVATAEISSEESYESFNVYCGPCGKNGDCPAGCHCEGPGCWKY